MKRISFEAAKLAHEKGLDYHNNGWYTENGELVTVKKGEPKPENAVYGAPVIVCLASHLHEDYGLIVEAEMYAHDAYICAISKRAELVTWVYGPGGRPIFDNQLDAIEAGVVGIIKML